MHRHGDAVPPGLRLVITGSDKVHTSSYMTWCELPGASRVRVAVAYGTTETAVTSTLFDPTPDLDLADEPFMPIGTPLAGVTVHVIDESGHPAPIGAPGELFIGGVGVARGYHRRPELTASRFVTGHPASPDERLYRTGDRVRRRADGNLAWLGRMDGQIKLRGLLIEPAEIEAALAAWPHIAEAVVVLDENGPDEDGKRLVAFVTTDNGVAPPVRDVQWFLRTRVPEAMVPHQIVALPVMPTSATGKVDQHQLLRQLVH
jgi:acyl-coenzyme A synthetase/AMP-(fatty) acid ligase